MGQAVFGTSEPVSRVLSFKTAIYLGTALPLHSSHLLNAHSVAAALQPPPQRSRAGFVCVSTVLLRIEFTAMSSSQSSGGRLSPPFHPYLAKARRYISVALFLKSPSAGVTRYPCPTEPGLSSWTAFRPAHAAVQLTCSMIVLQLCMIVKWEFMRYNNLMSFYSYEEREATVHAINSMGLFEFTQG